MQNNEMEMNSRKTRTNIRVLTLVGVMTAVICILGPLSIPIGAVPIAFGNLAIFFSVYVLGMKLGTISCIMYLLIGLCGLPVFTAYSGGFGKLLGPTGGYLVGYIFMAFICGFFIDRWTANRILCMTGMILGQAVCYLLGTLWFIYQAGVPFKEALFTCVVPFIAGDLLKMVLAAVFGPQLRAALAKAGLRHGQNKEK